MKSQILGAFVVLLVGLSAVGWAVQYPVTVSSIDIEGTVKIKDRDVLEAIGFQPGDQVTEADLKNASQAVFDLGWFSEVAPDVGEDGEIRFSVVENPVIRKIVITGNTHRRWYSAFGIRLFSAPILSTSKIQQILYQADVKKRKVLNREALETAMNDVLTEYNDRGYVLVALGDVEIGETLSIEIVEGHVASTTVTGLRIVPAEEAEKLIDLPLGEPIRRIDVQRIMSRINESVYFTSVEVVPQPGPERDSVVLEWKMEERDLLEAPVRAERITLEGISCFEEQTVYDELGDLPHGTIDNYDLLQILEGVYDLYIEAGYMMTRFVAESSGDGTVGVRIDEGRVSGIVIAGTRHTKDYVILRKLDIEAGRVLNRGDYLVSQQSLRSLGYFNSVNLVPEWIDDGVEVTVNVGDKTRLGGFEGSMALDPRTGGVVGELKLRQKNLFGTGQDVSLSYSRGLAFDGDPGMITWDLGYTSMAFFPEFDRVGLGLYKTSKEIEQSEETLSVVTYGVRNSYAYPVADYSDLGLTYKHEEERTVGETNWTPTDSVTVALMYDDIEDPNFPTGGTRRSVSLEKAGGFSAGREYFNLGLHWVQFQPVDLSLFGDMRQVVGVRVKMGWGDDRLPTSQYYELGGSMSVRGIDSISVPRMLLGNCEYRVELAEEGLHLVTFLDAGVDLDAVRLDSILATAGLEIAVDAAGIFVRLDAAWPLSSEWRWMPKFEIGFGRMF